jgi:hypothetical protein
MADENSNEGGVVVGGAYKERDDFVPNPTDMYGTFNTHGVGAHHDPATVSPIFEADRVRAAQGVIDALDPENPTPSDRVLFAAPVPVLAADNEAEKEELLKAAQARVDQGVVIGGPSEAEKKAALSGQEGADAAAAQQHAAAQESGALAGTGPTADSVGTVDTTGTEGNVDSGAAQPEGQPGSDSQSDVEQSQEQPQA